MPELSAIDKKALEVLQRNDAEVAAAALPLPGPAGEAFATGPIKVGDKTIRKIVKYDWRVWQLTGNAIVKSMAEFAKPEAERQVVADDDSDTVAVWMLTHTCAEVEKALAEGLEKFKARCIREIEFDLEGWQVRELFKAVMEQVMRSCATAVKYAAQEKDGEASTTFTPVIAASPGTDLAG